MKLFLSSALFELQAAHLEREHLGELLDPLGLDGVDFRCLVDFITLDGVRVGSLPGSVEVFLVRDL